MYSTVPTMAPATVPAGVDGRDLRGAVGQRRWSCAGDTAAGDGPPDVRAMPKSMMIAWSFGWSFAESSRSSRWRA